MFLKKVEMKGFKSFADNVTLDFKNCITSIIGPNGSGKSNIADAIKWVMGEQSLKALRGKKSQDVIFSGTQFRKALSFAEVTLILDNSDQDLDIDYNEVSITRRLYRSGESEYLINKNKCRLKDIYNLLLDTGVGKDGYSVIGQGKVEELLSSKSEDRRNIFDEAAGIMKYKTRKKEALRKLERTQENLLRIDDIINEIESGLDVLKEQAEKAKVFMDLRQQLKKMETSAYVQKIENYESQLQKLDEDINLVQKNITEEQSLTEKLTNKIKSYTKRREETEKKLEDTKREYHQTDQIINKKHSDIRVWKEKHRKYKDNISNIKRDIEKSKEDIEEIRKNKEKYEKRLDLLKNNLTEYTGKLEDSKKEMQTLMDRLDDSEKRIEQLKMKVMDKLDMITDRKTSVSSINNHIESLNNQLKKLKKDIEILKREKENCLSEKAKIKQYLSETEKKEKEINENIHNTINQSETMSDKLKKIETSINKLVSAINTGKSKYNLLKNMEKSYEGYKKSVKAVFKADEKNMIGSVRIHGTVADVIKVKEKYETAIEMALGGAMQNVITENENDAKKIIGYLRKGNHGRVTLMPVSTMKPRYVKRSVLSGMNKIDGFIGTGDEIVFCPDKFNNVVKNLLGRIIIAKDYDSAINIAKAFSYYYRIVTLKGDIINAGGSITGGSTSKYNSNILSRKRIISELKNKIIKANEKYKSLNKKKEELENKLQTRKSLLEELRINKRDMEHLRIKYENKLESLEEKIENISLRIETSNSDKRQFEQEIIQNKKDLKKHNKKLQEIESDIEKSKQIIYEHESKHKDEKQKRDNLTTKITDYKVSINSFKESIDILNNNLRESKQTQNKIHIEIERKNIDINKNQKKMQTAQSNIHRLEKEIQKGKEKINGSNILLTKLKEESKVIKEDLESFRKQIEDSNKNIFLYKEQENKLSVKKTKIDSDMDSLKNRMWDEYEITYAEALNNKQEKKDVSVKEINSIKKRIKKLGSVNAGAIEEYNDTKSRYDFLQEQKEEMESAKEKLKRVVYKMNSVMKSKFMGRLKEINKNFKEVFSELFEGGKAELVLADEENILESDIEVFVQPPGKKLQNMMLLSGGERALSAISLLFSIMLLKPAPFCILDEIEAALDEVNVQKFIEYLRNLPTETQYILITHRKGTMQGSDILYGVTMQEHGVSNIVSLDIEDAV